jgi:hypothetical protein
MHSIRLLLTAAAFLHTLYSQNPDFNVRDFACSMQTLIESRDPDDVDGIYRYFAGKLSRWTNRSPDDALAMLIDPHICRITERFR